MDIKQRSVKAFDHTENMYQLSKSEMLLEAIKSWHIGDNKWTDDSEEQATVNKIIDSINCSLLSSLYEVHVSYHRIDKNNFSFLNRIISFCQV